MVRWFLYVNKININKAKQGILACKNINNKQNLWKIIYSYLMNEIIVDLC